MRQRSLNKSHGQLASSIANYRRVWSTRFVRWQRWNVAIGSCRPVYIFMRMQNAYAICLRVSFIREKHCDIDQTSVMHELTCWRSNVLFVLSIRSTVFIWRFVCLNFMRFGVNTWPLIVNFHFDSRCQQINKLMFFSWSCTLMAAAIIYLRKVIDGASTSHAQWTKCYFYTQVRRVKLHSTGHWTQFLFPKLIAAASVRGRQMHSLANSHAVFSVWVVVA